MLAFIATAAYVTIWLADAATRDVGAFARANGCASMPMRSRIGPTFPCTPDELDALPLLPLWHRVRRRLSER
jgi:hypothetical protein